MPPPVPGRKWLVSSNHLRFFSPPEGAATAGAGPQDTGSAHRGDLMGMAATGKQIEINEQHIIRIANGKAVEHWGVEDNLGMMQQLGVVKMPS